MENSKIVPVEIDGETIWIEVEKIEVDSKGLVPVNTKHPSDLRRSATPTGMKEDFEEKITSVGNTLKAVVGTIKKGIAKVDPDEWSVELTIDFEGEKKIPFLAKGGAKGSIKVNAKWKK